MSEQQTMAEPKHVLFEIEVPVIFTDDLVGDLREFKGPDESESEWLLNCIGEPGPCILRVEISGEKDSDVGDVRGLIREARLVDPGPGYGPPHLTDEQLEEATARLVTEPDELIGEAVGKLLATDTNLEDVIEDLEWQLDRVKRRAALSPTPKEADDA